MLQHYVACFQHIIKSFRRCWVSKCGGNIQLGITYGENKNPVLAGHWTQDFPLKYYSPVKQHFIGLLKILDSSVVRISVCEIWKCFEKNMMFSITNILWLYRRKTEREINFSMQHLLDETPRRSTQKHRSGAIDNKCITLWNVHSSNETRLKQTYFKYLLSW